MIPLLLVLQELSDTGKKLSRLIEKYTVGNYISGELNFKTDKVTDIIKKISSNYSSKGGKMNEIGGVSFEFDYWRFNIRGAANEPLIRLNIESKDKKILEEKKDELISLINIK